MVIKRRIVASVSAPPAPILPSYDAVEVEFTRQKIVNPPLVPIPQPLEQIGGDPTVFREKPSYIPPHKHEISDVIGLREELDALESGGGGSTGDSSVVIDIFELTANDIALKYVSLSQIPADPAKVELVIFGGIEQRANADFLVDGAILVWESLALELLVEEGCFMRATYLI